jgi:hypothetical protein
MTLMTTVCDDEKALGFAPTSLQWVAIHGIPATCCLETVTACKFTVSSMMACRDDITVVV